MTSLLTLILSYSLSDWALKINTAFFNVRMTNNTISATSNTIHSLRRICRIVAVFIVLLLCSHYDAYAQDFRRGDKRKVNSGIIQEVEIAIQDSLSLAKADSIMRNQPSAKDLKRRADSIARIERRRLRAEQAGRIDSQGNIIPPEPWFGDSTSLSKVCLISAVLPGYGQIYNKQYWKLPILYGTLGTSIGLAIHYGKEYKPLKRQYDQMIIEDGLYRTEELNTLQRKMIRKNTTKQLMWGLAAASYIYFLGDAAVNYSTNDVSDVKKATTLSLICPGAGQVYNKSYWRVPIVIGGMASMIYVIDWNNRGYQRFKEAYTLRADFETNPGKYPGGVSADEFRGRYSVTFLKNLRDSYRRSRDLSIILTVLVYAFQAVDAHVDAHLKDFDVSDNLSLSVDPLFNYQHTQTHGTEPVFGFNVNLTF